MGHYLIDNNVISDYFSGLFSEKSLNFIADVFDQTPTISVITEIEALSWVTPDKRKEAIVRAFIKDAAIYPLTSGIVTLTVKIRRSEKNQDTRCHYCSDVNCQQPHLTYRR